MKLSKEQQKAKHEERTKLALACKALSEKAASESRDFTPDEAATFDARMSKLDLIDSELEAARSADHVEDAMTERRLALEALTGRSVDQQAEGLDTWAAGLRDLVGSRGRSLHVPGSPAAKAQDEARSAWSSLMDRASGGQVDPEQRALVVGTSAAGGFLSHPEFQARVLRAMESVSPLLQLVGRITTATGAQMQMPTLDDAGEEGEWVGEGAGHSEQDPVFGQVTMEAYKAGSKYAKLSWELLQDSLVDVVGVLQGVLGRRLGRLVQRAGSVGTGVSQPEGFITRCVADGQLQQAAGSSAITYADIVNLYHRVPEVHRAQARWMCNDNVTRLLRLLVDTQGRSLWMPSLTAGNPDLLMGRPILANHHMSRVADSGAYPLAFGDFGTIMFRSVAGMRFVRLDELFALNGFVGFFAHLRCDIRPLWAEVDTADVASTAVVIASNVATVTAAGHGKAKGDLVSLSAITVPKPIPTEVLSVADANTFTVALTAANGAMADGAGLVHDHTRGRAIALLANP